MNTEQDRALWRETAALARIGQLEGQLQALQLLLIRKSEALAVFADQRAWKLWTEGDMEFVRWNGADECRDPMAFAARERDATEGDDR